MRRSTLWQSKVFRGIGSNTYIQAIQSITQFASVAVFTSHWGLKTYGIWLMFFTIPSYLVMTDFGLATAATAEMTASVARKDRHEAVSTYQAVRLTTLATNAVGLIVAAVLLFGHFSRQLHGYDGATGGSTPLVLLLLCLYGAATLQNGVTAGGFSATGGYAAIGYMAGTMMAAEAAAACVAVLLGGTIFDVACCYLLVRIGGTIVISVGLARRARWLTSLRWQTSFRSLRRLVRPAAGLVGLAGAQAASIQGTVAILGFVSGPAAVPAFTVVRTMSRLATQAILIVNHAMMPSFSMANAIDNRAHMTRLVVASTAISLALSCSALFGLLLVGRPFVVFWTHGVLRPSLAIVAVMGLVMFVNTLWAPIGNLIMATNQHGRFAVFFIFASFACLALSVPMVHWLGALGAGLVLLVFELAMVSQIARVARDLGIADWRLLPSQLAELAASLRTGLRGRTTR